MSKLRYDYKVTKGSRLIMQGLVDADDDKDAAREVGIKILAGASCGTEFHKLGENLVNGVPYYYDYSVYLDNLGRARHGVFVDA